MPSDATPMARYSSQKNGRDRHDRLVANENATDARAHKHLLEVLFILLQLEFYVKFHPQQGSLRPARTRDGGRRGTPLSKFLWKAHPAATLVHDPKHGTQ